MSCERDDLISVLVNLPWHSKTAGYAADAILAAGWTRRVLDDATVERAARALAGTLSVFRWEHIGPLTQEMYRDKARAVLAAAVEPPRA